MTAQVTFFLFARSEFFKPINHTRFANPVSTVTSAGDPRIMQMALKAFY